MTTLFHCESENCCAVCRLHQCGLTVKQMRRQECLNKRCRHLEKIEEHQIWRQRERVKQARKARKQEMRMMLEEGTAL